jgi:hypothetical protein
MNSHDVTVALYALIFAAGGLLQLLSYRQGSHVPSLGTALSRLMRTRTGRVGVVTAWAWLGLHFFAR